MMKLEKNWFKLAIFSGVSWSLFYQLILVNLPIISQLDVKIIDTLMRLKPQIPASKDIVLVKIKETDLRSWGVLKEPNFYSKIAQNILDSGAKVVVLNLLPNWIQFADENDNPLKELISNNPDKIVLVTRIPSLANNNLPELKKYNQLFPFDSETNLLTNPQKIQGFFSYDSTTEKPLSLNHPARLFYLKSNFILADNLNKIETFDSVALLTLKKYQSQLINFNYQQPIYLNYHQRNFLSLKIEDLKQIIEPKYFQDKIVIIGFVDIANPNSLIMPSPNGEIIPALELQAHQIANLLTNSYYRLLPLFSQLIIIILGNITITYLSFFLALKTNLTLSKKVILCLSSIIVVSIIIMTIIFSLNFIIPYSILLLTWLLTYISIEIVLKFSLQEILLKEQKYELIRLSSSEQKAVLSQAKKLINRLASEIHDGPLQELKIIMDDLEMLEIKNSNLNLDESLNRVENLGKNIRKILTKQTNILLKITPELTLGLAKGIKAKIEDLQMSGELKLKVILKLQDFYESKLDSIWLANREDIFLFFCEAINNVIKHAQPPFGNATYVQINLTKQDKNYLLEIINDGTEIVNNFREKGGYGTKLMNTIASELPNGNWQKLKTNNQFYVSLNWEMA